MLLQDRFRDDEPLSYVCERLDVAKYDQ